MGFKHTLLFIYLLFQVVLFSTFHATLDLWFSFFGNAVILTGITVYHIYIEKAFSPFISAYIVFTYLFFLVAPIIQIGSFTGTAPNFINMFPYDKDLAVFTNILIAVFNTVFFSSYIVLKKTKLIKRKTSFFKKIDERTLPLTIITLLIMTVFIFVASYIFVQDELSRPPWRPSAFPVVVHLFWKKVFFLVPFGAVILCFQYFKKNNKKAVNLVSIAAIFLLLLLLLFWFKNPLTEKRNAIGPIYICLMFLFVPKLFNTNIKSLFFLFFTMIVAFPLSAILTHSESSLQELIEDPALLFAENKGGGIASAFNTLNYDAFSNIMATIEYAQNEGFAYGNQLLSAFLFFVPRGLWEDKPISTGELVGEYLIDNYNFTYSNLSNPMVSEGYINFGVIGVIIAAIALAFVLAKSIKWLREDDYLKKIMAFYLAIHLIFLLRGDFTNGFSYYVGTFIGVVIIPRCVAYLIEQLFLNRKQWRKSRTKTI